jgi:hypothetical protein
LANSRKFGFEFLEYCFRRYYGDKSIGGLVASLAAKDVNVQIATLQLIQCLISQTDTMGESFWYLVRALDEAGINEALKVLD